MNTHHDRLFRTAVAAAVLATVAALTGCGGTGLDTDTSTSTGQDTGSSGHTTDSGSGSDTEPGTTGDPGAGSDAPGPSDTPTWPTQPVSIGRAELAASGVTGANDLDATSKYLSAVMTSADRLWSDWFVDNGLPEPFVTYDVLMPGDTFTSTCPGYGTVGSDLENAFYCRSDGDGQGEIVLPDETFAKMWGGDIFDRQVENPQLTGDFAAAAIAAHEFGHHVQDELSQDFGVAGPTKPDNELLADCFSGAVTYGLGQWGVLDDGDVDEAIAAFGVIGDEQNDHGTDAQRQTAFEIGLYGSQAQPGGGEPTACLAAYWPAVLA